MIDLVFFSSVTENTTKFIEKLGRPASRIPLNAEEASQFLVSHNYVLVTPTYGAAGKGFVPKQVVKFLNVEQNRNFCAGVIGSGNMNFGSDFCKAAQIISAKCNVPYLYRFELAGTDLDVDRVLKGLETYWDRLD